MNTEMGKSRLTVVSTQNKSLFLYRYLLMIVLPICAVTANLLLPTPGYCMRGTASTQPCSLGFYRFLKMFDNVLDEPHHLFILVHIPLVIAMNQHFMFLLPILISFCDMPFTFFAHFPLVHSSVFKLIYTRSL